MMMSGPPPERTPRKPKPITQYFLDAREAFADMYGAFDIKDMSYLISDEVYLMLLGELDIKDISSCVVANYPVINSVYGISLQVSEAFHDKECALIAGGNEYHFEIPEPRKAKRPIAPPPQPTLNMYPGWDEPNRLWQAILSFIDWLNGFVGAEKSKEKKSGEQMASLSDLFEGYEENGNIPCAYRSSHPGWFADIDTPYKKQKRLEARPPPPPQPPSGPTRDATRR